MEKYVLAVISSVKKIYQKLRPDRSYAREAKRPPSKWLRVKKQIIQANKVLCS